MPDKIKQCMNCGQEIRIGPYCENCGQRNIHHRLKFGELIEDIQSQLLEINLPWLFTIRELTLRPGKVCRDYVEGKRVCFVNPLKYAVYISAIVTFLSGLLPFRYQIIRPPAQGSMYLGYNWLQQFLYNNSIMILMAACIVAAFFVRIFYPKTRYNKTEINSALLFIVGHIFFLYLLLSLFTFLISKFLFFFYQAGETAGFLFIGLFVTVLLPVFYVSSACKVFFNESWIMSSMKASLLAFLTIFINSMLRYLIFRF